MILLDDVFSPVSPGEFEEQKRKRKRPRNTLAVDLLYSVVNPRKRVQSRERKVFKGSEVKVNSVKKNLFF